MTPAAASPAPAPPAADAALLAEARALHAVARGGGLSVRGLDLALRPGEVVVLHGPVEAGAAVLRALLGIEPPHGGAARLLGQDPAALPPRALEAVRARVGWLPREGALLANLTLRENLLLPLQYHGGAADPAAALRRFGLDHVPDVRPEYVALPVRRRVALARAVLLDPPLLLLDDPSDDLEEEVAEELLAALAAWVAAGPRAILAASPDHGIARPLSARLLPLQVIRP